MSRLIGSTMLAALALGGAAVGGMAQAAEISSVSRITFGPDNTLFVADWKAARIDALTLPAAAPGPDTSFNILDLDRQVSALLGSADIHVESIAKRPGTNETYLAVSSGPEQHPAILVATPDGKLRMLDLSATRASVAPIDSPPTSDFRFWSRTPLRSFTVTDMKWHDGHLYVAGLSNQTFASALRIYGFPFGAASQMLSVAMYHTSHNQTETRAPIRTMTFATLNGQDTLVAGYLCSPLVTIPVAALKDGAHVEGKTVAEFGYGDVPIDMVAFSGGEAGQPAPYLMITNAQRGADMVAVADIAAADRAPGLAKPVAFGATAGVASVHMPLAGVIALDSQNDGYFVALRRDLADGRLQLVSINKTFKIRISDFVSEYDFPDYRYTADYQVKYIKPVIDALEGAEGFGAPGKP